MRATLRSELEKYLISLQERVAALQLLLETEPKEPRTPKRSRVTPLDLGPSTLHDLENNLRRGKNGGESLTMRIALLFAHTDESMSINEVSRKLGIGRQHKSRHSVPGTLRVLWRKYGYLKRIRAGKYPKYQRAEVA